jgi:hypothetical protein
LPTGADDDAAGGEAGFHLAAVRPGWSGKRTSTKLPAEGRTSKPEAADLLRQPGPPLLDQLDRAALEVVVEEGGGAGVLAGTEVLKGARMRSMAR